MKDTDSGDSGGEKVLIYLIYLLSCLIYFFVNLTLDYYLFLPFLTSIVFVCYMDGNKIKMLNHEITTNFEYMISRFLVHSV